MKYYLVALFDDESYKTLNPIQRNISKKFKANRNSSIPYIPLEIIENPNIDKLNELVDKIIKPYKYFKVELSQQVNICDTTRTLNLKIQDVGYIKRLSRIISDTLKMHGFNVKDLNNEKDMHLTMANINYLNKDNRKYNSDLEFKHSISTLKVNRLELWKLTNNKREVLIQTYPLRNI